MVAQNKIIILKYLQQVAEKIKESYLGMIGEVASTCSDAITEVNNNIPKISTVTYDENL